jgi:alpha-L-rhamnosidase
MTQAESHTGSLIEPLGSVEAIARRLSSPGVVMGVLLAMALSACAGSAPQPVGLRCEYLHDPLGIDAHRPRLSWVLEPVKTGVRGQRQSAYHILVASDPKELKRNHGDLWDSGKVASDQSIQVHYAGMPLTSERECFWKVKVWDENGQASKWSAVARWSMGLLSPSDWSAKWIGLDGVDAGTTFTGASWIWFPEGRPEKEAPVATRYFRRAFELPPGRAVKSARWLVAGDNQFTVFVNGSEAGTGGSFKAVSEFPVHELLRPGKNVLAASVKNAGEAPNPAGFVGRLSMCFDSGETWVIRTDASWRSSGEEFLDWQKTDYDDSTWLSARVLGEPGMPPWGEVAGPENRRLPARLLRKEFRVDQPVRRATVYLSGLGLSELFLNGAKVGDAVLSPALSEYEKRVFFVTHDVTSRLRKGANAIGVLLGNGRFYAPRGKVPTDTRGYGFPKLLLQLRVEFADGSDSVLTSDESWRITDEGPICANNEYDGEEYDARREAAGWCRPGFDDGKWPAAGLVAPPGGALRGQMIPPLRVIETVRPIRLTQPQPGTWIYDLGQNLVGWCRLRVSGPAGTSVTLRHAETLKPDGTLYLDNIRSAKVTDIYTLKGKGREVYEPRFTYHGFRYVEVRGFPGKPDLSCLEGRVVHDDLEPAGAFSCSNPLLNRIYTNIVWGVRGNYRSLPTDCPQRDERQGWLGDRSAESKGETYLFNTAPLYSKWVQDMADAQKPSGSVPDVCPAYWPIYSDNVTWPSSTVIIPASLREQYGDNTVIETHYSSAKKWMDYISTFVTNGIISRDSYGDWCVPPEDPKLIHSNDPARTTDPALLATAYLFYDATLMARYAAHLGRRADERYFSEFAAKLKAAFNARFFNAEKGYYDNGTQTSCVLPLAFGLVPEGQAERVFAHLVRKISLETSNHIGTGLIGGQFLMRVLSEHGRPDLAYTIATQRTYPSWGYMVEKGATTIWELWNGDTADPAMNSGNHVMLVGDLVIWLYEHVAGIKPDPEKPGFKHILMRPEPVGDLRWAKATHRSPYGLISSEWERDGGKFRWKIKIPVNTTATVFVPATGAELVRQSGRRVDRAAGVKFIGMKEGRAVYRVGSGDYSFESVGVSVPP